MWKKVCKYHVFHDILRVCIFLKKTVTSTRTLTTERVTYHDMLHKNLWVSHDQTLRYFVSNFLRFNHVRQLQPHHHQRTSQMKAWNNQKMFSLVNMAMVNHSLFIFFARLTMFIVKLDRKLIRKNKRLGFSFWKQNTWES